MNPHRKQRQIVDVEAMMRAERDLDAARPRERAAPTKVDDSAYVEYAILFAEKWPGRPIEYLRWTPAQMRKVTPWLKRSAEALNKMAGTVLAVPAYDKITPLIVLRLVVCHWRMFTRYRLREFTAPVPEAIVALCCKHPNLMLDNLLGICGQRVKKDLEAQSRAVSQVVLTVETARMVDERRAQIHATHGRLLSQVRWLEDDDFQDAISEERIGERKRDVTMH